MLGDIMPNFDTLHIIPQSEQNTQKLTETVSHFNGNFPV